MQETVLETKSIYEGRLVKLSLCRVRLPDGNETQREIINHPGAVAVVALDDEQQVLLVRQFRLPAAAVLYEVPAGTLEPGEEPDICANRELREETGYRARKLEAMGGFYAAPGYSTEYIHLFLGMDLEVSQLQNDIDEFLEVEKVPLRQAVAMIEQGEIVDSKSVAGLLRVARRFRV